MEDIKVIAKRMMAAGKGIFAADASEKSMNARLKSVGVEADLEVRRKYRQLLLTTVGLGDYVSGVILNDEIIRQATHDGKPFVKAVEEEGIIPGIKVDKGTVDMANFPGEKIAEGLDGLRERLAEYHQLGARFTKWRAVIKISKTTPTSTNLRANAECLARFATLSQEAGMVPIVEPEVVMEGDHTAENCEKVTEEAGKILISVLSDYRVDFGGLVYKVNMVLPGKESTAEVSDEEMARMTVETLRRFMPVEVSGVVFLSGGQDEIVATRRLNAINKTGLDVPWRLTFSFERGLENAAMKAWIGKDENVGEAQKALLHRARMNALASMGKYEGER